jgi:protein subunit release factor A
MPWSLNIVPIRKKKKGRKSDRRMKQSHHPCETDPEIFKKQVVVETYRSRGPGGQRKNKTETAVRLTHLPSGIVVIATEQRSQAQNRELAFERLRERLLRLHRRKKRRIPTRISQAAVEKRIEAKKTHSRKKALRMRPEAGRGE